MNISGIEKSVFFNKDVNISRYRFFYVGSEFCERKIPNVNELKKFKGKYVVLMTPILTNKSIDKIINLVENCKDIIKEVVINDIGIFDYLKNKIKINIGRVLLVNMNYSFNHGIVKRKITNWVNAFEIDPLIIKKGYMFGISNKKFHLHLPFSYLGHSKNCSFEKMYSCKLCSDGCVKIKSKIADYVYMCFNAYFLKDISFDSRKIFINKVTRIVKYNMRIVKNI